MEYVSDVSAAAGDDASRPSYFELAAQHQLRDLLAPVFQHTLAVLAARSPALGLRLLRHADELQALLAALVERHYLSTYASSFAEHFYALRRCPTLPTDRALYERSKAAWELAGYKEPAGLSRAQVNRSLALLVGVPYVLGKLERLHERLAARQAYGPSPPSHTSQDPGTGSTRARATIRRLASSSFVLLWPYVRLALEATRLANALAYLFAKTPYWRPSLWLLGLQVRRMSTDDHQRASAASASALSLASLFSPRSAAARASTSPSSPSRQRPRTLLHALKSLLTRTPLAALRAMAESAQYALPLAIFALRFAEWWFGPEGAGARNAALRASGRARGGSSMAPAAAAAAAGGGGAGKGPLGFALRAPPSTTTTTQPPRSGGAPAAAATTVPESGSHMKPGTCVVHSATEPARPLVNATALPSGYVGCYTCLARLVGGEGQQGRCPVTAQAFEVHELRKLVG